MSESDALLRGILETPADDTARLVYADWLEEHGERNRAEFIRVQIAFANLREADPACPACAGAGGWWVGGASYNPADWQECPRCLERFTPLLKRQRELLDGHGAEWGEGVCNALLGVAPVASILREDWFASDLAHTAQWRFWRGFVSAVVTPIDWFLKGASPLFAAHPVESVRLTGRLPYRLSARTPRRWAWLYCTRREDANSAPDRVPGDLFWHLPGAIESGSGRNNLFATYETEDDALAALSAACVTYGRKLAGLTWGQPGAK